MARQEVARQVVEQPEPGVGLRGVDPRGPRQVVDLQRRRVVRRPPPHPPAARLADDQRGVLRPEEAGAERRRVEEAIGRDAHEAGQLGVVALELLGDQRAEVG